MMESVIKFPKDCSIAELDVFEKMVREGGQVSPIGLRGRIEQAAKLIFITQDGQCVAIAGLKNPLSAYKNKVFDKAGLPDKATNYKHELGYLYATVIGAGNQLMQGILDAAGTSNVFATTKDSNQVMQHLLPKYGFVKLGHAYKNDSDEYYLELFGKES